MIYDFTPKVQEKILALLCRDSSAYQIYNTCVKPKYFENGIHIDLSREIFHYWNEYSCPPTQEVLEELVSSKICITKLKRAIIKEYLDCVKNLYSVDMRDVEFLRDKVIEFGRRQAMTEAIMNSAEIITSSTSDQYKEIEENIKKALLVGEDLSNLGTFITRNVEERFEMYKSGSEVIERIPSSMELLNTVLKGGLGRKEMGVVIAPPGRGKTTFLINMGAGAVREGYKVFHYTLENDEKVITRNYDNRLVQRNMMYLKEKTSKAVKVINAIRDVIKGELVIKTLITKKSTVDTIRSHINQVKKIEGISPDLIVVDYGAILGSNKRFTDKRNIISDIYEELRGLAVEFDCALWTAVQTNRGGLSKKVVSMADIAEAFEVAATADVLLALCQTVKEKKANQMRYFLSKVRDSKDSQIFKGKVDHETKTMTMDKEVIEKIEEDVDFDE